MIITTNSYSSHSVPRLIDTHCHLHDLTLYQDVLAEHKKANPADFTPEQMLKNANSTGVRKIITIGTNHLDSLLARDFVAKRNIVNKEANLPEVFWSYGVHPEYAGKPFEIDVIIREKSLGLVAIGEVGLDYHYPGYDRLAQIKLFEEMIDLSIRLNLPLILHIREAFDDFFGVIKGFSGVKLRGVVHSFSDNQDNLSKCLNLDFFIGVNGLATFAEIPLPPLEKMVLETDAPFLAPKPYRGKINQPAHVKEVANWVSERINQPITEVATKTTENAENLFQFS